MVELEREGLVKEESELRACGHGGVYRNGSRSSEYCLLLFAGLRSFSLRFPPMFSTTKPQVC